MHTTCQEAIINVINNIDGVTAEEYAGELENPKDNRLNKAALPIVYIDFVEDDTSNPNHIDLFFSMYIVHISFSKNKENRKNVKIELDALLNEIYENIAFKSLVNSEPIELGKLKKIYDANAAGGYMTVFRKSVSMRVPNPIIGG